MRTILTLFFVESLSYLANLLGLALPNVHLLHASLKVCSREGLKEGT